jgi:hypothetical protein
MPRRLAAVAAILVLTACSDPPYREYASAAEAIGARERDMGWLPPWFPASAKDVHIQVDPDNGRWWVRAKLSRQAADSLRAMLSPIAAESVAVVHPPGGGSWWFEGLIEQQPANDAALYANLFRGSGAPVPLATVVAFDRTSPDMYAWTTVGQ